MKQVKDMPPNEELDKATKRYEALFGKPKWYYVFYRIKSRIVNFRPHNNIYWWFQRRWKGWDDRATWSMDYTLSKNFIIPMLKQLKKNTFGYPSDLDSFEEWEVILDKMILGHELVLKCVEDFISDIERDKMNEGLNLFREYYLSLWT